MTVPSASLSVFLDGNIAWIKIVGRANFQASYEFKKLVHGLKQRGMKGFVLDAKDCLLMDSTFLGVLAGFGMILKREREENPEKNSGDDKPGIVLVNPSDRVMGLLENIGAEQLVQRIVTQDTPEGRFQPVEPEGEAPSKLELSENSLEAHRLLMGLKPENEAKFKDVARFLEEDLERLRREERGEEGKGEQDQAGKK